MRRNFRHSQVWHVVGYMHGGSYSGACEKTLLARSGDDPLRPRCPPLPPSAHPSHQDAKLTRMITTSRPSAPKMPIPPLEHPRCPPLPPRCKADSVEVTCCLAHHGPDQLCIAGEGGALFDHESLGARSALHLWGEWGRRSSMSSPDLARSVFFARTGPAARS